MHRFPRRKAMGPQEDTLSNYKKKTRKVRNKGTNASAARDRKALSQSRKNRREYTGGRNAVKKAREYARAQREMRLKKRAAKAALPPLVTAPGTVAGVRERKQQEA